MNNIYSIRLFVKQTILMSTLIIVSNMQAINFPKNFKLVKDQVLREGLLDNPVTFDPQQADDAASNSIMLDIYNQLINYDQKGLNRCAVVVYPSRSDSTLDLSSLLSRKLRRQRNFATEPNLA